MIGSARRGAHGRLQRFALVALSCFIVGLGAASSMPSAVLVSKDVAHQDQVQRQLSHADGSPCPDSEQSGHPCGEACACICCPGHAVSPVFFDPRSVELGPSPSDALELPFIDDLHPKDVRTRVFHPPRA
jgi:hypothetical protein